MGSGEAGVGEDERLSSISDGKPEEVTGVDTTKLVGAKGGGGIDECEECEEDEST